MITLTAFALVIITITCVLTTLRALGTRWPWEMVPVRMGCYQDQVFHWIPTKQVTCVRKALEQRRFLVLNLGSVNGMTLIAKCEVAI